MIDEFIEKLRKNYEPMLGQMFQEEKARAKRIRLIIMCVFIFAIGGMFILPQMLFLIAPLMIFFGIALVIHSAIRNNGKSKYDSLERKYTNTVGKEMASLYFKEPTFSYPNSFLDKYIYRELGYGSFDRSECDFELNFKYKDRAVKASSIHLEDVRTDNDGNTYTVTVFRGLFCYLDLGYDIGTKICIAADALRFGKMGCAEKVRMDSKKFERFFDIYTNDKIKAMQLLTADVMEKLADLFNNSDDGFDIVIDGRKMYIRVSLNNKMFAINYFGELFDKKIISRDILALGTISNAIDLIDYGVESNHLI